MTQLFLIDDDTRKAVLNLLTELPTGPVPFKVVAQSVMALQSLRPAPEAPKRPEPQHGHTPCEAAAPAPPKAVPEPEPEACELERA
jgi:hypothetical protein